MIQCSTANLMIHESVGQQQFYQRQNNEYIVHEHVLAITFTVTHLIQYYIQKKIVFYFKVSHFLVKTMSSIDK